MHQKVVGFFVFCCTKKAADAKVGPEKKKPQQLLFCFSANRKWKMVKQAGQNFPDEANKRKLRNNENKESDV